MAEVRDHRRSNSSLLRSLLGFQHLNFEDMFVYIHNLNSRIGILQDYYRQNNIRKLCFMYVVESEKLAAMILFHQHYKIQKKL